MGFLFVRIRIYRVERMLGYGYHPLIPCQALGQAFDSSPIKGEGDNAVVLALFTRSPRCGFWIKSRMTVPAPPPCGLTSLRSRCASVCAFSAEELRSSSFSSRKRPAFAGMTVLPLWAIACSECCLVVFQCPQYLQYHFLVGPHRIQIAPDVFHFGLQSADFLIQ